LSRQRRIRAVVGAKVSQTKAGITDLIADKPDDSNQVLTWIKDADCDAVVRL
jgi:hypothetical protein